MKRLGLTLVAAVCLTATTFAAGNQPTTAKWEGNINITKLSKYLNLDSNQHEEVANICEYFTEQMERATNSKKNQEKLLRNAVYGNRLYRGQKNMVKFWSLIITPWTRTVPVRMR